MLSRGTVPSELEKFTQWWNDPQFLGQDESEWPSTPVKLEECDAKEMKKNKDARKISMETSPGVSNSTLTTVTKIEASIWRLDPARFSSWLRLKRVRAWVIRFINNCRLKKQQKNERTKGELTSEEINDSENQLIRFA